MTAAGLVRPAGLGRDRLGLAAQLIQGAERRRRRRGVLQRLIHGGEELAFDSALGVLQLVQPAAQILAVARFDALANRGPGGQGLKLAAKRAHHGLVLWLGQQELERGDFNLVGLGDGAGACKPLPPIIYPSFTLLPKVNLKFQSHRLLSETLHITVVYRQNRIYAALVGAAFKRFKNFM